MNTKKGGHLQKSVKDNPDRYDASGHVLIDSAQDRRRLMRNRHRNRAALLHRHGVRVYTRAEVAAFASTYSWPRNGAPPDNERLR